MSSAPFGGRAGVQEREVGLLSARSGVAPGDVRALFIAESARLAMGAKIGSYLTVLAAASVRGMLRRKARLAVAAGSSVYRPTEE